MYSNSELVAAFGDHPRTYQAINIDHTYKRLLVPHEYPPPNQVPTTTTTTVASAIVGWCKTILQAIRHNDDAVIITSAVVIPKLRFYPCKTTLELNKSLEAICDIIR